MSAERPVRQRSRYAWAYDGVKFTRIIRIMLVVVVVAHKSVNDPHNHDPMLEASTQILSDETLEEVSTKMDPSVPPNCDKNMRDEKYLL